MFSKEVKMLEVKKLSKLLIVCYTIAIVIDVSNLLSAHRYCSINFTLIVQWIVTVFFKHNYLN